MRIAVILQRRAFVNRGSQPGTSMVKHVRSGECCDITPAVGADPQLPGHR